MSDEVAKLLFVMSGMLLGMLAGSVAAKTLWNAAQSLKGS